MRWRPPPPNHVSPAITSQITVCYMSIQLPRCIPDLSLSPGFPSALPSLRSQTPLGLKGILSTLMLDELRTHPVGLDQVVNPWSVCSGVLTIFVCIAEGQTQLCPHNVPESKGSIFSMSQIIAISQGFSVENIFSMSLASCAASDAQALHVLTCRSWAGPPSAPGSASEASSLTCR